MKEMMQWKMCPYLQKLLFNIGDIIKFADQPAAGI